MSRSFSSIHRHGKYNDRKHRALGEHTSTKASAQFCSCNQNGPDSHKNLTGSSVPMLLVSTPCHENELGSFCVIMLTSRQTDRLGDHVISNPPNHHYSQESRQHLSSLKSQRENPAIVQLYLSQWDLENSLLNVKNESEQIRQSLLGAWPFGDSAALIICLHFS